MSRRSFRRGGALLAAASLALAVPAVAAQAAPADQQRQRAFAAAAEEFGVPESVLLGVSFLESRWDYNAGTPSTAAGYGPMHLTDLRAAGTGGSHHDEGGEDPRGDGRRPELHPSSPGPAPVTPQLQTIDRAAQLIGTSAETLREDPVQNIRGGAALLADYQRQTGARGDAPADWYGAVARYSGTPDGSSFADEVFETLRAGVDRVTDDGQHLTLAPTPGLAERTRADNKVECPRSVSCESVPAPYQELPGGGYGNHDLANRPQSQKIDYIVIHDTEGYWDDVLKLVQDPTYVSWNYSIRSNDGHIAQHVPTKDVAYHAGNWYVNSKSIGVEHEGFAAKGAWYTEAMYRTSAKLVRYLAGKYRIPLDRAHIIGHDNVPGINPAKIPTMHWDPGPYWDWSHYFDLLGAPFDHGFGLPGSKLVTITPDFATNKPAFTGCEAPGKPCTPRGSTSQMLRTEPDTNAPLLKDMGLHPDGTPSTVDVADVGSRIDAGQRYAVAEVRGDWTAVWYLGQKGWFFNPRKAPTAKPAIGTVVTPKPGKASVPVYGTAYPEASAYPAGRTPQPIVPLPYSLQSGQRYSSNGTIGSEYYYATKFDPAEHLVVKGKTKYVQVQFGHRIAYVNADDVLVLPAF